MPLIHVQKALAAIVTQPRAFATFTAEPEEFRRLFALDPSDLRRLQSINTAALLAYRNVLAHKRASKRRRFAPGDTVQNLLDGMHGLVRRLAGI